MDRQNLVYPYNAKLFSHKKERSSDTCYNMDKSWKHDAKWKKLVTKDHIVYELSRIGKSIETESKLGVT